jgi:head-tail adaptor
VRAGLLRERVTFQRRAAVDDGAGSVTAGAWADLAGCVSTPAQLRPMRQTEETLAEGVRGTIVYQVTVRATAALRGVTVGDRMIDARVPGRMFNVKAPPINLDERGKALQFLVETGGADG